MIDLQHEPEGFQGFERARRTLRRYEARAHIHDRLMPLSMAVDPATRSIHIDNHSNADAACLQAFDINGARLSAQTVVLDEPGRHLDVTPEFDHDFTHMPVPHGSDLEHTIETDPGWTVDMCALREHDCEEDRRRTRRAVFLAQLQDMLASGEIRGHTDEE